MAVAGRLLDRCALVTGAGDGIGAAVALRFSEEGARVACIDIDQDRAAAVAARAGRAAFGVWADVSDEDAVRSAVERVVGEFGRLDIVCNAASSQRSGSAVTDTSTDDWETTAAVNLRGPFLVGKHALPALTASRGSIVNVASTVAFTGARQDAAHGVSQAGVMQLTQAMALDYAPDVRVNCVCSGPWRDEDGVPHGIDVPGSVETLLLNARLVKPSEIADGILFLASDDASYMTGAALPIDGGLLVS